MNKEEFIKVYWKQYNLLEKEFIDTDNYVSIDKINYDTYSVRYLNLLLTICSEMDSLAGEVCKLNGDENPQGFRNRLNVIMKHYPYIMRYRIDMQFPWDIKDITPLVKFGETRSEWWQAYNDVKHQRMEINEKSKKPNYTKANLKNVLFAMAALYIIELTLYENLDGSHITEEYKMESKLFKSNLKL